MKVRGNNLPKITEVSLRQRESSDVGQNGAEVLPSLTAGLSPVPEYSGSNVEPDGLLATGPQKTDVVV
ncbi:UNVERIFIED_CONTAM: hypothetical protein K2H54_043707 [Gekko kuhli]